MNRPYTVVLGGTFVLVITVLATAVIRPEALAVPGVMRVEDFGAYWTGTVVNLRGGNAYDPANLAALQAEIEPARRDPLPAWSPPWTFAALAPLAPLGFAPARWAWLVLQGGMAFGALAALWRVYAGPADRILTVWVTGLVFYPTLQMLGLGQHSSLVLLGVAGWLACLTAGRDFVAGAFLALVLVKPQNLYLVGWLVAIWAADRRAWRMTAGGLVAAAFLTAVAVVPNPDVFGQYQTALTERPPAERIPPTAGTLLRLVFGPEHFWLVFIPPVGATVWGVYYYARNRAGWSWPERLPVLLFVSYLTSPYGWVYDQVLFLIPLAQVLAAAWVRRPPLVPWVLGSVGFLTAACLVMVAARFQEFSFAWHAPLGFGLYLAARRATKPG